jgi:ABC-2 type transport system permease protein
LNVPLLFAANARCPLEVLPGLMRVIVLLNPAGHLTDGLRSPAFGQPPTLSPRRSPVVMTLFAVAAPALALRLIQRSSSA